MLNQTELSELLNQYKINPSSKSINDRIKAHCNQMEQQIRSQYQYVPPEHLPVFTYKNCIQVFGFVKQVLAIYPKNVEALILLETIYRNLMVNDRVYEAIALHEHSIMPMMWNSLANDYGSSITLHLYISKLYCACAKFTESIAFALGALRLNPQNKIAHVNLRDLAQQIFLHYLSAKQKEANATGDQQVAITKTVTYLRFSMTSMYRKALLVAPKSSILHHNYGIVLQDLGRKKESEKHFQIAKDLTRSEVERSLASLTGDLLQSERNTITEEDLMCDDEVFEAMPVKQKAVSTKHSNNLPNNESASKLETVLSPKRLRTERSERGVLGAGTSLHHVCASASIPIAYQGKRSAVHAVEKLELHSEKRTKTFQFSDTQKLRTRSCDL